MDANESIDYDEEFYLNSAGLKLFACRWVPPTKTQTKALVFLCHGYGVDCSLYLEDTAIRLAKAGFGVFGLDCQGHGKSEGMHGYINKFSQIVIDSSTYFASVKAHPSFKGKPSFLLGESMGGAVALLIHRLQPNEWSGAVLVAPMCKISKELQPPTIVRFILSKLALIAPTWKIVPTKSILDVGFHDADKREKIRTNPYIYLDKPRLKTGLELLNASLDLEKHLSEVSLPFLVLHGDKDVVTDPTISENLYKISQSKDKAIKIYPDMWHALITAEPDANMDIVFGDIITWLNDRSPPSQVQELQHIHTSKVLHEKMMGNAMKGENL